MRTLAIDIETYSPVDLAQSGIYPYSESPDFEILLFAYAFDDEPVKIIDIAQGERLPLDVLKALTDPDVQKTAFNAAFERICIGRFFSLDLPIAEWDCTMVRSAMLGLPLSLDAVSRALKLPEEKMVVGKALIRYFSIPCNPTKANGGRSRNLPRHDPGKWELFKRYCIRDVEVERAIRKRVSAYRPTDFERKLWVLDQQINDRGVGLDMDLVESALLIDERTRQALIKEASDITGLPNPNSAVQLKEWLSRETEETVESLTKEAVSELLPRVSSARASRVLQIRRELAKTSVKKYEAMSRAVCRDSRIRGLLQYYGANRTGRWAGRLVQVHNLPQNHLKDLDLARQTVLEKDPQLVELLFGNVPDTLSQLIRTALIAKEGHTFFVADFSAIEARVIAYLAGEKWRLDVFRTHGKIYEASASQMFKVPIESVTKGSPLRQKGKIAELALGYQGGVGALQAMGALKMGVPQEELPELVEGWRAANPAIVKLWDKVNRAATRAVEEQRCVDLGHGIDFSFENGHLFVKLPSGRRLCYLYARIGKNRFGSPSLLFDGMDQTTKKWGTMETYGGKLVENIVQAVARDCLAVAMMRMDEAGYEIVFHVHDEVISEVEDTPDNADRLRAMCSLMGKPIPWAPGLPLRADGYITKYYKKD